jgi:hypothetical protein
MQRAQGLSYQGTPVSKVALFHKLALKTCSAPSRRSTTSAASRAYRASRRATSGQRPGQRCRITLKGRRRPIRYGDRAALEQRPATYSFPYSSGRFRAKAQVSPPADLALATDIHAELKNKALEARDRLLRSNAPKRVRETIDRLRADLGVTVGDVSPGKLLMRSRSLDADVAAYDTVEARREIAEDALAQVIDVAASVTDLKSCLPRTSALHSSKCLQFGRWPRHPKSLTRLPSKH